MMRILLLLLVGANLILLTLWQTGASEWFTSKQEPWRVAQQIAPDSMRIVSAEPPAPQDNASKAMAICMEFGGFTAADAQRVETLLATLGADARVSSRQVQENASYIVYLPPYRDKADAERAIGVLRRNGVTDFYLIQNDSPLRLGISLGIFKTREGANARLAALRKQGITLARAGQRSTSITKTWFRIESGQAEVQAELSNLRKQFASQTLKACAASPATSGASSATRP